MSKFLVVHPLKAPTANDDIVPIAKSVKASNTPDAYWVKSWLQLNAEGKVTKILCEWDGRDTDSVTRALRKSAPDLPVEGVYAMGEIQSESYR